jgi:hypothetical protein
MRVFGSSRNGSSGESDMVGGGEERWGGGRFDNL